MQHIGLGPEPAPSPVQSVVKNLHQPGVMSPEQSVVSPAGLLARRSQQEH